MEESGYLPFLAECLANRDDGAPVAGRKPMQAKLRQQRGGEELGNQDGKANALWSSAQIDLQKKDFQSAAERLSESYADRGIAGGGRQLRNGETSP